MSARGRPSVRATMRWRRAGAVVGGLLASLAGPTPSEAQVPVPGQGVAVDIEVNESGAWYGEEVELLSSPRTLSLRGPIEGVDAARARLRVLGLWVRLDEQTLTAGGRLLGLPETGEWVEVKVASADGPVPRVLEIELGAKETRKVKGTVTAVLRQGPRLVLAVDGHPIELDEQTDWDEEANGLFSELFGELKADDMIGDDPGYRQIGSRLFVSGSVRPIARLEDSFSLTEGSDELLSIGEPTARIEFMAALPDGMRLFAQGQVRRQYELYRSDELLEGGPSDPEVQLRQFYLSATSLFDLPLGVTAGKQRVRDNREFLFDEYLDGIRLYAYPFQPLVFEASIFKPVFPLKDKFETWTDVLLQARWFLAEDWRVSVYGLRRWDDDPERRRNVDYVGGSLEGRWEFLKLWGNGAVLRGEDKGLTQDAYAWDLGLALRARSLPLQPGASVSMATGSGDRDPDDNVSNDFRQTGYEDNSSRVWGLASFRHFGEALDPELSNIRVQTATFGVRTASRFSLDLVAHRYRLDVLTDELDNVGLEVEEDVLNETNPALGWGGSVILALRDVFPSTHFTYKVGAFLPGDAFDIDTDQAWLHKLEFRIDF